MIASQGQDISQLKARELQQSKLDTLVRQVQTLNSNFSAKLDHAINALKRGMCLSLPAPLQLCPLLFCSPLPPSLPISFQSASLKFAFQLSFSLFFLSSFISFLYYFPILIDLSPLSPLPSPLSSLLSPLLPTTSSHFFLVIQHPLFVQFPSFVFLSLPVFIRCLEQKMTQERLITQTSKKISSDLSQAIDKTFSSELRKVVTPRKSLLLLLLTDGEINSLLAHTASLVSMSMA